MPLNELPQPLQSVLGYEFYEESPVDHRVREYLLNPDPEERWKFYARVDDLAQDIAGLLEDLARNHRPAGEGPASGHTIYLAESASDVAVHRDNVKRELERRGHRVLPQRTLPLAVEDLTAAVSEDLSHSELSIHLLGDRYGARPEEEERSIPHLQIDLASEAAVRGRLRQLIWLPEALDTPTRARPRSWPAAVGEHRPRRRGRARSARGVQGPRPRPAASPAVATTEPCGHRRGDEGVPGARPRSTGRRSARCRPSWSGSGTWSCCRWAKGSEAEAREVHEASMVLSDAVIIYYGTASEHWVRMKLFDLVKAPGWGRREPFRAKAVWVGRAGHAAQG